MENLSSVIQEIYIYGYPMVLMETTKNKITNGYPGLLNRFLHAKLAPAPMSKFIAYPSTDSLYSIAWLDLSDGPFVLHVPDTQNHYYLLPILDAWTNVFTSIGTRTTGNKEGEFLIMGPSWQGSISDTMTTVRAPTNMVWIIGRIHVGSMQELKVAYEIQHQFKITRFTEYTSTYCVLPSNAEADDFSATKQVHNMQAQEFFNILVQLMKDNPPSSADKGIVEKMIAVGIIPGKPYVLDNKEEPYVAMVNQAVKNAYEKIKEYAKSWKIINGWILPSYRDEFEISYLHRAAVAMYGLGANLAQDAIYWGAFIDEKNENLNGSNNYVLHFAKEQIPPVNAFWSVTAYNSKSFFDENIINRYALGSYSDLIFNVDGSLDIYIQHENPGNGKESNWLPAPKEFFSLMLRLYWPKEEVINGSWFPPAVLNITD